MTWIRFDCELPSHPVIGLLARELRVDTDRALACYCRTLLGFGSHRVDGRLDAVADVTLEEWAKWRGKAGRWAAAFRAVCVEQRGGERDNPGVVKGWWRQRALLEKQRNDALKRRETREGNTGNPPETREGFTGHVYGNGNKELKDRQRVESLASQMAPEGVSALEGYLRAARDPDRLLLEIENLISGLSGPGGRASTPQQVGRALHEMALAGATMTSRVLSAFVRKVLEPEPPGRGPRESEDEFIAAGRQLDAAKGGTDG